MELVSKRALPGTLVFDHRQRLVFYNREALCILNGEKAPAGRRLSHTQVPKKIRDLCRQLKKEAAASSVPFESPLAALLETEAGLTFAVRAFYVGGGKSPPVPPHIMVLLEKVGGQRGFQLETLTRDYRLTRREIEVVRLICDGAANKEIADRMKISEFTVRDHIKNILQKMDLHTRNEVVAFLINQAG